MKTPDGKMKVPRFVKERVLRTEKELMESIARKTRTGEILDVEESAYVIKQRREEIEDRARERRQQHGP